MTFLDKVAIAYKDQRILIQDLVSLVSILVLPWFLFSIFEADSYQGQVVPPLSIVIIPALIGGWYGFRSDGLIERHLVIARVKVGFLTPATLNLLLALGLWLMPGSNSTTGFVWNGEQVTLLVWTCAFVWFGVAVCGLAGYIVGDALRPTSPAKGR